MKITQSLLDQALAEAVATTDVTTGPLGEITVALTPLVRNSPRFAALWQAAADVVRQDPVNGALGVALECLSIGIRIGQLIQASPETSTESLTQQKGEA